MPHEKITRRHLPHWYMPGAAHFVTYRLVGTIPAEVLQAMRAERESRLRRLPDDPSLQGEMRERIHKQFFARFDYLLDHNRAIRHLADPRIAAMIRGNLYHHRGSKYHLLAYCVMPNHVHVLLQPIDVGQAAVPVLVHVGQAAVPVPKSALAPGGQAGSLPYVSDEMSDELSPLAKIMHSLKSYTANEANRILNRRGEQFWQPESYDHWVRDDNELERIVEYIAFNPVKAGLVHRPSEWLFCSAHDRFLQDGEETAWLLQPESTI